MTAATPDDGRNRDLLSDGSELLGPERPTIRLISANHAFRSDIEWIEEVVTEHLRDIPRESPLVIWAEEATPFGCPLSVYQLPTQYVLAGRRSTVEWPKVFTSESLSRGEMELFEATVRHIQGQCPERAEMIARILEGRMEYPDAHPNPQMISLPESLEYIKRKNELFSRLSREFSDFTLLLEDPPLDSYIAHLQKESLRNLAIGEIFFGEPREALRLIHRSACAGEKSYSLRDEALVTQVLDARGRLSPGTHHVIFRGLGHNDRVQDYFFDRNESTLAYAQLEGIERFNRASWENFRDWSDSQALEDLEGHHLIGLTSSLLMLCLRTAMHHSGASFEQQTLAGRYVESLSAQEVERWYQIARTLQGETPFEMARRSLELLEGSVRSDGRSLLQAMRGLIRDD